ncbi:MAG: Fe-S cluster assembly ATPase SufC [Planctomycetota bacterium]
MLEIRDLHAEVEGHPILKGLNLKVNPGEVHSIMGPNGSGKSTLAQVLAGNEAYEVTSGEIIYNGKDLLDLEADERAAEGVFMAFQYPVEIPGVSNMQFLKSAMNAIRKYHEQDEINAVEFMKLMKERSKVIDVDERLLKRSVNEGFSGGEKKRYEIFQMALLEPKLAVLDETDSGLDIDALKIVANGVNALRDESRSFVLITHYQRLLNYIVPDFVHVMVGGRIVKSGGKELALELEEKGYTWVDEGVAQTTG